MAGQLPGARLGTCRAQDPVADGDDQVHFLGQADEIDGGNAPQLRVGPAQQRFHAHHLAAGQVQLGLVFEVELVPRQGVAQLAFQSQPLQGARIHARGIELPVAPSLFLGAVHGDVGVLDQGVGILAIGGVHGHAHAATEHEFVFAQLQRLRHGIEDALQGGRARLAAAMLGQQQHEFVAAQARHRVDFARGVAQAPGHVLQHPVARVVAQRVVDELETVEVDEDHPQGQMVAPCHGHRLVQPLAQQGPVGQAREDIVARLEFHLLLEAHDGADVVLRDDKVADGTIAIVAHGGHEQLAPVAAAILADIAHDGLAFALFAQGGRDGVHVLPPLLRPLQVFQALPDDFAAGIAGDALEGGIDIFDQVARRVGAAQDDGIGRHFDDAFAQPQRLFIVHARGDVLGQAQVGKLQGRRAFARDAGNHAVARHELVHPGRCQQARQHSAQQHVQRAAAVRIQGQPVRGQHGRAQRMAAGVLLPQQPGAFRFDLPRRDVAQGRQAQADRQGQQGRGGDGDGDTLEE